jgi:hypothetical protein
MYKIFLTLFLGLFFPTFAVIYEAYSIDELSPHLIPDTLIIFGFDNTVVESAETLGAKPWRDWVRNGIKELEIEQKLDPKLLIAKHLTNIARFAVPMKPIEGEKTTSFFRQLETDSIPYFFLTCRPKDFIHTVPDGFAKSSYRQLKGSGLSAPLLSDFGIEQGFLFAEADKGASVKELLIKQKHLPKRVLFFDNTLSDIQSVKTAIEELGIEFIGFHFQYKPDNLDPLIANIQFEVFLNEARVPNVEEAKLIKASFNDQDPTHHFNALILSSYKKIIEKSFSLMNSL